MSVGQHSHHDVPADLLVHIRVVWRSLPQLLSLVVVVDKVSDSDELLLVVGASDHDGGHSQDILLHQLVSERETSLLTYL